MAKKLGDAFLRCALGPLHYAGGLILSGKVADGLRELSVENLHGGLTRGVGEAARQVGVGVADVELLLPMDQVKAVASRLDAAQREANKAWESYAGQTAGLLKGVADLTVDGRAPDVSHFLQRLATKLTRDGPLAEPLQALSVEVASWLDVVEQCGEILADGGALATAYRRRRVRRAILATTAAVAVAGSVGYGLWLHALRARVEDALSRADPCAVSGIAPADSAHASAEQRRRLIDKLETCNAILRRTLEEQEEQRRRDEQARAETQKRLDREAHCASLAEHVAGGGPTAEDEATAEGKAALLGRVAHRQIDPADLAATDLPCADTPSGAKIEAAFAAAVVAPAAAWTKADAIGDRARRVLVEHRAELDHRALNAFGWHADDAAKKACIWRAPASLAAAAKLCQLKDELAVHGGKYCAVLFAIAGPDGTLLK